MNKTACLYLNHNCRISQNPSKDANLPTSSNAATTEGKSKDTNKVTSFPGICSFHSISVRGSALCPIAPGDIHSNIREDIDPSVSHE